MAADIELGGIPNQRISSWRTLMDASAIIRSPSSISTVTGRSRSIEPQDGLEKLTYKESQCEGELISFIVGDDIQKGSLQRACQWYSRHLQMRFKETWHLLAPSLVGLADNSSEPRPGDLAIVYKFVLEVGRLLSVKKNIALVEFVDELDNNNLLKPQMDGERAKPNQIVFAAIGWLTMFYEVMPNPSADSLEVETTSTFSSGLRNAVITRKFSSYRQSFERIAQPLEIMLGDFGCLIPMPRIHLLHQQLLYENQQGEDIIVHSICFKTLQQTAGLQIELVNSLNLHLELDSERKTLKLFKYPSFCRMMIDRKGDRKGHILSRLLNDHAKRLFEDVNPPDIKPTLLFEEILRSYRLIFGQDERSWKAFSKILTKLEEDQCQGRSISACDPLLRVLCGQSSASPEARAIYEEIDVRRGAIPNGQTTHCNLYTEFPFLGTRLLELQRFDRRCQPQTVRSPQGDKCDVAPWFTLRSKPLLVFLTTFTILLLVVVLGLQIWQTMLLKQRLEQGQGITNTS